MSLLTKRKEYDIMNKLDKSLNTTAYKVESKEEQRRLLSSNKASGRCSSLNYPNTSEMSKDVALNYLANILVRIHLHLENNDQHNQSNNYKKGRNLL